MAKIYWRILRGVKAQIGAAAISRGQEIGKQAICASAGNSISFILFIFI